MNEWTPGKIKDLRRKLKLSQNQLAQELHVAPQTVYNWEHSQNRPSNLAKRQLSRLEKDNEH